MKPFIYSVFILLLIISCEKQKVENLEFTYIETLMEEQPDSALILLEAMSVPPKSNKQDYATYALLLTKAMDKNYKPFTSDSLINTALDYFNTQGDSIRKATAFYYAGRVSSELKKNQEATAYYLRAAEIAETTDDYKLLSLIYSNLGYVYLYQDLYEHALPVLHKAHAHVVLLNDSIDLPYTLRDLGRIYLQINKNDSAEFYYNEAIAISKQTNNYHALSSLLNEAASIYKKEKKYDLALSHLTESKSIHEENNFWDNSQVYLNLGHLYLLMQEYDSALVFLNKALVTENIYTKAEVYKCLYILHIELESYKKAIENNELFLIYSDSIEIITHKKDIAEIQAKYNQQKLINDKNQLLIEKSTLQNGYLWLSLIVIIVIALLILFYQKKLLAKERHVQKAKDEIRLKMMTIKENEALIKKNQDIIHIITEQLNESKNKEELINEYSVEIEQKNHENQKLIDLNKDLQSIIDSYAKTIEEKGLERMDTYEKLIEEKNMLEERESELVKLLFNNTPILNKVISNDVKLADGAISKEVTDIVNAIYKQFIDKLVTEYPSLNEDDLLFCSLMKLRLSTSAIAELCCLSTDAVTKRKQRIKMKMGLGKDTPLNSYILNY